jgi:MFS transporter, DHA2 family, multidrug resistance protein
VWLSTLQVDSSYAYVITIMCVMALGTGFTMAPATESVMGSLPREKAGVGSAVNDTTRQVGGALGVGVVGTFVASVYAHGVDGLAARYSLVGPALAHARGSLGAALEQASSVGANAPAFVHDVRSAFVDGLADGVRVGAVVVGIAVVVAFKYLPARGHDHVHAMVGDASAASLGADVDSGGLSPVAGS